MRKVYLPIYLIEWSDIRPYALMAGHGIKVGAHYTYIGLSHLAVWLGIALVFLWKLTKKGTKLLFRGLIALLRGIWNTIIGIFTIANPNKEEDDDDQEEEVPTPLPPTPEKKETGSFFDGES